MLPVLAVVGAFAAAWYVLIVRPQRHQEGRHASLVGQLVVGAHVMTVGGIYGRIQALEGNVVVIELAPGMVTRVATDGIARLVNSDTAALPELATPQHTNPGSPPIMDRNQHHPQQPVANNVAPQQPAQPQYAMPAPQLPAAPWTPAPGPAPAQPWQQAQAYRDDRGATTLRADVQPMPMQAPMPQYQAQPVAYARPQFQPHPQAQPQMPSQYPAVQAMPTQHAPQAYGYAPLPSAPVLQPFPGMSPVAVQPPAQPLATASTPYAPQQLMPAPGITTQQSAPAVAAQPMQAEVPVDERTHSKAPEGMGATVRLDDMSIRDQVLRARSERQALAKEYERVTAPLVDVTGPAHAHAPAHIQHVPELVPSEPVPMVAHSHHPHYHHGHFAQSEDAPTMPIPVADGQLLPSQQLFAASSSPMVQPIARFPQPAAFQRNAPWAPDSREATPA